MPRQQDQTESQTPGLRSLYLTTQVMQIVLRVIVIYVCRMRFLQHRNACAAVTSEVCFTSRLRSHLDHDDAPRTRPRRQELRVQRHPGNELST